MRPKTRRRGFIEAHATSYGHSFALLVPKAAIPEHSKDEILEVTVARGSEPTSVYSLYTVHTPGYKRAYLDISQLKAKEKEKFLIESVTKYSLAEFVKEYGARRPGGLENTRLEMRGKRVVLRVDGKELTLSDVNLRTYQGAVVLDARLSKEAKDQAKIAKSLEGFSFRLADHSLVTTMSSEGEKVLMTYQRTRSEESSHTREIP